MYKQINIIWVGPQRLPYKYYLHIKNWAKLNPDYQINFITDENSSSVQIPGVNVLHWTSCFDVQDKRQEFLLQEAKRALNEKAYATVSNLIRFVKIYNDGGFYFDTDIIPIESLKPLEGAPDFLAQPKETWGELFAKHRFVVSAIYGSKHSPVFDEAITVMYESYKEKSLQDAIKENPDQDDYLRSFYTASLMLSRTIKRLYTHLNDYEKLIENCQSELENPVAFCIKQDSSWGEGLKAILKESEALAACTIQRFFKTTRQKNIDQIDTDNKETHLNTPYNS